MHNVNPRKGTGEPVFLVEENASSLEIGDTCSLVQGGVLDQHSGIPGGTQEETEEIDLEGVHTEDALSPKDNNNIPETPQDNPLPRFDFEALPPVTRRRTPSICRDCYQWQGLEGLFYRRPILSLCVLLTLSVALSIIVALIVIVPNR
ncbi:hypothetical protein CAPTEDRAFT_199132 [Capitella teleta]|uniref:Uncharacterized protein n=1 Tax=Capitella teleta TaxID=283909 RepID=R7V5X0_CAPTE|nr:hypothetical protein CAPTEDRAFT_199132 [Capitella teleta]|eukprot:ELU13979.1 hypothetical protein CAPTEDRAFT_199132 [Capitella teleta]